MSSMFKKKGGPAFKPKIPSARPRPAISRPASQSQPAADSQPQAPAPQTTGPSASEAQPIETIEPKSQTSSEAPPEKTLPSQEVAPASEAPAQQAEEHIVPPEQQSSTSISEPQVQPEKETRENAQPRQIVSPSVPVVQISAAESSAAIDKTVPPPVTSNEPSTGLNSSAEPSTSISEEREGSSSIESSATPSVAPPDVGPSKAPSATPRPILRKQSTQTSQEDGAVTDGVELPKKRRSKASQDGSAAPPRETRKRKTPAEIEAAAAAQAKRRARSLTPPNSESHQVDLQKLKMSDLTRDLRIGRKTSRHDELRERERRARVKARLSSEDRQALEAAEAGQPAKRDSPADAAGQAAAAAAAAGPQFRIVDGQIVVDQSSLVMDRHARDVAAQGHLETVEENDFTRLITSNSFMNTSKLKGPNIWTDAETEMFYRGLCMFGIDFEMISKMIPGKQRRQVKLKFNREERHCPARINAALVGEKTVKIDLDEYKAATGAEFEPVEVIEARHRKVQDDFEAEQKRVADEQAEIMRKKREELFADDDEDEAAAATKRKRGKRKQAVSYGLNGEPIGA